MKRFALVAVLGVLTACSQTSAQQAKRPAPDEAVATVGTSSITLAEVDDKALEQPVSNFGSAKLSQALYEARRAALEELIATRLIDAAAKAQGIERDALIEKEITSKISPVSDADVAALAIEHGLTLCSADGDFARFPGLRWINPLDR